MFIARIQDPAGGRVVSAINPSELHSSRGAPRLPRVSARRKCHRARVHSRNRRDRIIMKMARLYTSISINQRAKYNRKNGFRSFQKIIKQIVFFFVTRYEFCLDEQLKLIL